MIPAAIYTRFSTDRQDARSIDDQLRRCREFATRNGYEVIAEFSDAAISGTHTKREQLQALLAGTRSKRRPFRAVIVDDLSRLSRDIGDTHTLIFRDLAGVGIKLVDTSGLDSEADSGEMTIAMGSIINSQYVKAIAKQTHRGLTGRALAGFSTGGSLYGFRTITEGNPTDPEHPRKLWVIHEPEAEIVRRIFDLYDQGAAGYKAIAETLNSERIAAPRDGRKGHKIGEGWGHSSVRAILSNPKYIGRWIWNAHKWTRNGHKTVRRERAAHEHVTKEMPELAIIDRPTWDRVQKRLVRVQRTGSTGGRPAGAGRTAYLLSGLLKCGQCGGPMSIHGMKMKAGVRYANFACSANRSRGDSICSSSASISERKITSALIDALRETLSAPTIADHFVDAFERKVRQGKAKAKGPDLEQQLRDAEKRVANVTKALARMPDSEALYAQLASEEATVKALRAQVAQARPDNMPRVAPSKVAVRGAIGRFLDVVADAPPARGREALARVMTPLTLRKEKTPGTWSVSGALRLRTLAAVSANLSSGGRI